MILLYTIIFLLFWSVFTSRKPELLAVSFFIVMAVMLYSKTFVGIYDLPDIGYYFAGYEELGQVGWLEVPVHRLVELKCPEIGFRYILKIGAWLGSFHWSLFIIALVHVVAYIKLSRRYSPYVTISLIIFLLGSVQSFFVLRQHLAIAIMLFAYPYIISRDWRRFSLLMLLALSFHLTAVVFLPVYFVYGIDDKGKLNLFFVLMFFLVYFSFIFVFGFIASHFAGYESYVDIDDGNITTLIIAVCYLVSYIFFLRQDAYADGINRLVLILLVLNCIVMSAGYTLAIVSRLMMYYSVVNILSVPITMSYIKRPIIRYAFCAAILFLLIYQFCGGSNAEYLNGI